MINYLVANRLLGRGRPSAPYWEAAGIAAVALLLALATIYGVIGSAAAPASGSETDEDQLPTEVGAPGPPL